MKNAVPLEVASDLSAVIEHVATGKPIDHALINRIKERSKNAQEELVKKYGVREIAVDLIREGREE